MTLRSKIRAALVDGPKSVDELTLMMPESVYGDRHKLANNMSVLATEHKVRRCGLSEDGKPLYQLQPDIWPAKERAGDEPDNTAAEADVTSPAKRGRKAKESAPGKANKGRKPASARTPSPTRAQRPDAKAARKPASGKAAGKRARQPGAALDLRTIRDGVGHALDLSHPTRGHPTADAMASLSIDAERTRDELIACSWEAELCAEWLAGRSTSAPRDLAHAAHICRLRAAQLRALARDAA
jgi:hypothetical protein